VVDVTKILDVLSKVSIITGLLLILIGGYRRLWVWGYQLEDERTRAAKREDELKAEIREWKEVARRNEQFADRSLSMHERRQGGA
jgi:hypothetical protein